MTTTADANELAAHYISVMDALIGVIQQETELVRAGRLAQAAQLEQTKTELSRLYIADTLRLRANRALIEQIAPDTMPELVRRHDDFRALLQINLTVLATAHAVSEGIVRGVSGELARKSAPQTYGASGRANAPDPRSRHAAGGQPGALSADGAARPPFFTVLKNCPVKAARRAAAALIHFMLPGCAPARPAAAARPDWRAAKPFHRFDGNYSWLIVK